MSVIGRRVAAWRSVAIMAVAALSLISVTGAVAAEDPISVNIVDAPRPLTKWGYAPANRKLVAGTWVTWSNNGQDAHTVTAVDGSFDSGSLDPSEGFSWYFDEPGTYAYVCALHPWMTGKIIVTPPPTDDSSASATGG